MRVTLAAKRAEVWGKPIAHSRSPLLHNAAYEALGWDVGYTVREVDIPALEGNIAQIDGSWLGVSLTMPLKEAVLPFVMDHRGVVDVLGAANTIVMRDGHPYLENTDPVGVVGALESAGSKEMDSALILGAGATARSVLYGLQQRGIGRVLVSSRDERRSEQTLQCAKDLGLEVSWMSLASVFDASQVDLVVSTLPSTADPPDVSSELIQSSVLFDVVYDPWPSPLATLWNGAGRSVISGMSMLVHQAIAQIRLFHCDDLHEPLPGEERILEAMWRAVGEPWASGPASA